MGKITFGRSARASCALGVLAINGTAAFGGLPSYTLVGAYDLPAATDAYSLMPDGRVLAISGGSILAQDSLDSASFSPFASVDPAIFDGPFGNFGASFLEVSPDGSTIAIGDNNALNRVHVLDVGALPGDPLQVAPTLFIENTPSSQGHWTDSGTLFVSGGEFGSPAGVRRIDTQSLSATTVVSNINGSPGGVTSDGAFLYTSNGFENDASGSRTGEVRAVPLANVLTAPATPIDFESSATPVARALSAASLGFDDLGNLLIGGGDFAGETGFAAVVDGDAIQSALAGGSIAPDSSELRLLPAAPDDFTSVRFNPVTREVLVSVFGSDTVYRYAIPTPGTGSGLLVGGLALATRRRRDA